MTDTRPVPMEVHHHLQDTNCAMTCIVLERLWAAPDLSGPMVLDLRWDTT